MKEKLHEYLDSRKEEIFALGDELFHNPELGFKEFKTREIIMRYLKDHGLQPDATYLRTGLSVSIGSGKPHIGLIAEMDAIPTAGHPDASCLDNAAHSCGHSTQCTDMLAALDALNQVLDRIDGKVTLFFTPAEEFTDMEFRRQLIEDGEIAYPSGKQNMLADHMFDDVDLLIHLHGSGQYQGYQFSLGSTLAGFVYKRIHFLGTASHAAVSPHTGCNALNMCVLFLDAVNMLRETFREEDHVRFHGMIDKGGDTVNSIPSEVIYECYVRSSNPQYLLHLAEQVDNAALKCAQALGGTAVIEDTPGYLPLVQSKPLNDVIYRNMLQFCPAEEIRFNEVSVAAGDVGDISAFKPIIQYGYTGFAGRMHGADLQIIDKDEVYLRQAKLLADSVYDLLSDHSLVDSIVADFKPTMTYQQYIDYLNNRK